MDLLQNLYRTHFNVVDKAAFKKLICLLLALFVDRRCHPLEPLVEHERLFARDDGDDGVKDGGRELAAQSHQRCGRGQAAHKMPL